MKKLMTLMLGAALVLGGTVAFAYPQDTPKKEDDGKGKKKAKKKGKKKEETPKKDGGK